MDGICWTFTHPCPSCDKPVQVTNGIEEVHPDCAPAPAIVISGCSTDTPHIDHGTEVPWTD